MPFFYYFHSKFYICFLNKIKMNEKGKKNILQKENTVFQKNNSLKAIRKKKIKNIGLGLKTPSEAIIKNYTDKKCPFIGNVSIRGRIIRGQVVSAKMNRTVIIRRDYLHYISKYKRFEKRHKNIPAHCSPCFRIQEGDFVTIGQCRPLSKTIRFNVLRLDKQNFRSKKK